jgi:uncharacterized protein YegL
MPPCTTHGDDPCVRCALENESNIIPKVHVSIVLDKSGSMVGSSAQTIGGFNEYIKGLKGQTDTDYYVSLTMFDHAVAPAYVNRPVAQVPELTGSTYRAGGGTALYDALGIVLADVEKMAKEDPLVGHMVVVITDGEDESSRTVSKQDAVALIGDAEKKAVTFAYIGANLDAFKGGEKLFTAAGATSAASNVIQSGGIESYQALFHGTASYGAARGSTMRAASSMSAATGESLTKCMTTVSHSVSNLFEGSAPIETVVTTEEEEEKP